MPRSIENIAASHKLASELRASGKNIWPYSCRIKDFLTGDTSPEGIARASQSIVAELRAKLPSAWLDPESPEWDYTLEDLVDRWEGMTLESLKEDIRLGYKPLEEFNQVLDEFYSWANLARVWVGGRKP